MDNLSEDGDRADTYRTRSGKVLTDEDIQRLADEAEQGYDVSHLTGQATDEQMVELPRHRLWALVFWELGFRTGVRTMARYAWRTITRRNG